MHVLGFVEAQRTEAILQLFFPLFETKKEENYSVSSEMCIVTSADLHCDKQDARLL